MRNIQNTKKEIDKRTKLYRLENIGALRTGHWVNRSHHFKATISIRTLLNDTEFSNDIIGHLVKLCVSRNIDHVIVPLYSNIGMLIPKNTIWHKIKDQ